MALDLLDSLWRLLGGLLSSTLQWAIQHAPHSADDPNGATSWLRTAADGATHTDRIQDRLPPGILLVVCGTPLLVGAVSYLLLLRWREQDTEKRRLSELYIIEEDKEYPSGLADV